MELALVEALGVADGVLGRARELGRRVAVAVLDQSGDAKVILRDDGATMFRSSIALAKAWGSIAMGYSSRDIGERFRDRPSFLAALSALAGGKIVPAAGGLLLYRDTIVIGAVGVSGGSSDEDEDCARAGIRAARLATD